MCRAKRAVYAQGLTPRLRLDTTIVNFKKRTVSRDRVKKIPFVLDVPFTNDTGDPLSWRLDTSALEEESIKGIFKVMTTEGHLNPDEEMSVRFNFLPDTEKEYSAIMPLYLGGEEDRPYLMVTVKGVGMFPHLKFDRPEVMLPVVPLGVTAEMTFYIKNMGFDMLEFRHRVQETVPMKVEFPEVKLLAFRR